MTDNDGENNGENSGPLVPQPHGGALRRGGKPGNKGGGRKPAQIIALMGEGVEDAIAELKRIGFEAPELSTRKDALKYWIEVARQVPPTEPIREADPEFARKVMATWRMIEARAPHLCEAFLDLWGPPRLPEPELLDEATNA